MIVPTNEEQLGGASEDTATSGCGKKAPSLPRSLLIMFGLNGSTLTLPSLAMLYFINDRVQIPVALLSAYGALSFLPWSFKPLYATFDNMWRNCKSTSDGTKLRERHELLTAMLVLSTALIMAMALVPPNGVWLCFLVAFLQNIATAFAEFLLGLTLLDQIMLFDGQQSATKESEFDINCSLQPDDITSILPQHFPSSQATLKTETDTSMALPSSVAEDSLAETLGGIYQGQAATARNIGSLIASVFLLGVLLLRGYAQQITYRFSIFLILLTSSLPLAGALITMRCKIGTSTINPSYCTEEERFLPTGTPPNVQFIDEREQPPLLSLSTSEKASIAILQSLVIWIGLKGVISPYSLWLAVFLVFLPLVIIFATFSSRAKREQNSTPILKRNVALYLVLVQTMPSASYQWFGYSYYLFGSEPILLQILSLVGNAASTSGSNVYAQLIATRVSSRRGLIRVIVMTTILSTAASLFYLIVTITNENTVDATNVSMRNFLFALPISAIASFFAEIRFLPSVALATSSVQFQKVAEVARRATPTDHEEPNANKTYHKGRNGSSGICGLQYGSYISCIDFGDQLGTWITVPIVSALGITRDDWSKMTELVLLCSICGLLSLTFLFLLSPCAAAESDSKVKLETEELDELVGGEPLIHDNQSAKDTEESNYCLTCNPS